MSLPMAKFRIVLYLALGLVCVSLAGNLGACSLAALDGGAASPAQGSSGGFAGVAYHEIVEPIAVVGKAERSAGAMPVAAFAQISLGVAAASSRTAAEIPTAPSTPLYLSHCVFLC